MVKSDLIKKIAKYHDCLTEHDVKLCVNNILHSMSNALSLGRRIEIRGFGAFRLNYRPSRNSHNPKTGQKVVVTQKYVPHFKTGKGLADRVNNARKDGVLIKEDEE